MQNNNDNNYYLHRNIYKEYSSIGSIYAPNICNLKTADNIILYGHHIKDGSMFGSLTKYKNYNYYKEHKYIKLMTDECCFSEYEIMAVIVTNVNDFKYYGFTKAENPNQYNDYIKDCQNMSIFETGVRANYRDKLVTLVTCEYSQNNGRMIIVAKKTAKETAKASQRIARASREMARRTAQATKSTIKAIGTAVKVQ